MAATDVLAALLQAGDTRAEARRLLDNLTEEFFHISSAYLEMVRPDASPLWAPSSIVWVSAAAAVGILLCSVLIVHRSAGAFSR